MVRFASKLLDGFGLLALIGLIVVLPAAPADAFDPYPWAKDGIPTCFTEHSWWTTTRMNEATAGIEAWENQVSGVDILHNTNQNTCSISGDVELNWTDHLDGSLAVMVPGLNGPIAIVFAQKDGPLGSNIPWSYDDTPGTNQYDFRSTVQHEIGHALGLHHPEHDDVYPAKSFDGRTPLMKANSAVKATIARRTLTRDDLAGGRYLDARQVVPNPELSTIAHWIATGGASLSDCGSYACITGGSGGMKVEFRFTTDNGRSSRVHLQADVRWRGVASSNPPSDVYELGIWITYTPVNLDGSSGTATTTSLQCPGSTSWQVCSFEFTLDQLVDVQDVKVWVRNTGNVNKIHVDYARVTCDFLVGTTYCFSNA